MAPATVRSHCEMSPRAEHMLELAMHRHGLSARAHDRILKLARTLAALESHEQIEDVDMQLAIDCRMVDRRGWFSPTASDTARTNQASESKPLHETPPSQAAE